MPVAGRTLNSEYVRVVLPDGTTEPRGKAWMVDGTLLIIGAQNGGARFVLRSPVISTQMSNQPKRIPHVIETEAGVVQVTVAACGCGSPLKRINYREAMKLAGVAGVAEVNA